MATPSSIAQLRSKLKDLEGFDELIQNDIYLALWLNLHHQDMGKAEAAIRDFAQWWNAKDVPSILQERLPVALANKIPIFHDGVSKDGLPVAYLRLSAMDIRGLMQDYKTAEIIRYITQHANHGLNVTLEVNRQRYDRLGDESLKTAWGHVAIVDLYGYSRKHVPPMRALGIFIQAARECFKFPSCARSAYIIGVSKFIMTLLKVVLPIINTLGVNLKIYGTDEKTWEPDIYKLIDKNMLEEFRQRSSVFENAVVVTN